MERIRIGAPDFLSSRPLVYGLTHNAATQVELTYSDSGQLADSLERGLLDAALIPSIEFLRGVGNWYVRGPALVARGRTGSLVFATNKRLEDVRRVAVEEGSRTPLAVLRVVLDKLHGAMPDFCVVKANPQSWRDDYDGVLLTGDLGLNYRMQRYADNESFYDVGEMWSALYPHPLVVSLWAYNDERIGERLHELLVASRDFAVNNLVTLSEGVSQSCGYDGRFLYDYFSRGWSFNLGREEEDGLKVLEDCAFEYQLIQGRRWQSVVTG